MGCWTAYVLRAEDGSCRVRGRKYGEWLLRDEHARSSVIEAFQVFGVVFVIIDNAATGGPDNALLFYMLYMWRQGFREGNLAYAAALAWILTTIGLVTVWLLFRLEKRFVYYESQ